MEHQDEFVEKVDNNTYKCPECGAPMQYDPESASLKCDYCNRIINLDKVFSDREVDFYSESDDNLSWQKENQLIRCASCGNENVISKKEMSTICPFCGSKQVITYDEIPKHIYFIENKDEPKEIGDLVYNVLPASITNALSVAVNTDIPALPLLQDAIYYAMQKNYNW